MKNSVLSTVAVFCLFALNPVAHAASAQIINGGNPRPQVTTAAPGSGASVLPTFVVVVLTMLQLM